jgi:hypothetical protein
MRYKLSTRVGRIAPLFSVTKATGVLPSMAIAVLPVINMEKRCLAEAFRAGNV